MVRRRIQVGLMVAAAVATALTAPPALAAGTDGPAEVVVPYAPLPTPRADTVVYTGATGYLHQRQGTSGYLWTPYAGGADTAFPLLFSPTPANGGGGGDDVVTDDVSAGTITFHDMAHGTSTTVATDPRDVGPIAMYGGRIVERHTAAPTLRVLTPHADGTATETAVTGWPDGAGLPNRGLAGDADTAVLASSDAAGTHLAVLDLASAEVTMLPGTVPADTKAFLTADRIGWYDPSAAGTVHLVDRSDPTAAPTDVTLPTAQGRIEANALVDGWIISARDSGGAQPMGTVPMVTVTATPLAGGDTVTLPGKADLNTFAQSPGGVIMDGGSSSADWHVERVAADPSTGRPAVDDLATVPGVPSPVRSLALSAGRLFVDDDNSRLQIKSRAVTFGTDPGYGPATAAGPGNPDPTCPPTYDCRPVMGTGTGFFAKVTGFSDGHGGVAVSYGPTTYWPWEDSHTGSGTLVSVDGDYGVYDAPSGGTQTVFSNGTAPREVTLQRAVAGAAVWGDTLWSAGSSSSSVTRQDLATGKTLPAVATGAPCKPSELQATSTWLYWSCGTTGHAGVYDLSTGKKVAVPGGPALLGDGYLVQHDTTRGELVLTELGGDPATPAAHDLAALPADPSATDDRHLTWTVDPYGGGVAYLDAQQNVHVLDPDLPVAPVSVISEVPAGITDAGSVWSPQWSLSRPATKATLTVTDAAGHVVRTLPATVDGATVSASWNGTTATGAKAVNGTDTWKLTVTAADGSTGTASGSVHVHGAVDAFRDYSGTGFGSVITLNSDGYLTTHWPVSGTDLNVKDGGVGWTTKAMAVPFGDLNKDGCADTLVRMSSGELRDYHGGCGKPLTVPSKAYTSLGTGFNQYKALLYTGDLNGDGYPDLLAWASSGGNLSLYPGTAAHTLGKPVLVKPNETYVRFIAVGDVTGDGVGDLLAYDHEKELWLWAADGKGGFKPRTPIFTNWGSTYNAMVGVGDITGDGRPDIIERDTAGTIWLNKGEAGSTFSSRTQLTTGWKPYLALY